MLCEFSWNVVYLNRRYLLAVESPGRGFSETRLISGLDKRSGWNVRGTPPLALSRAVAALVNTAAAVDLARIVSTLYSFESGSVIAVNWDKVL